MGPVRSTWYNGSTRLGLRPWARSELLYHGHSTSDSTSTISPRPFVRPSAVDRSSKMRPASCFRPCRHTGPSTGPRFSTCWTASYASSRRTNEPRTIPARDVRPPPRRSRTRISCVPARVVGLHVISKRPASTAAPNQLRASIPENRRNVAPPWRMRSCATFIATDRLRRSATRTSRTSRKASSTANMIGSAMSKFDLPVRAARPASPKRLCLTGTFGACAAPCAAFVTQGGLPTTSTVESPAQPGKSEGASPNASRHVALKSVSPRCVAALVAALT